MSYRGAELHLDHGRITISSDSIFLPPEFGYGENEEFLKLFVLSYIKFLCDSPLELQSPKPIRVIMRLYKRLTTENIRGVIKQFSSYADQILSEEFSPQEFGPNSETSIRQYHDFMKNTPIFKEYHLWTMTGRPDLLKYVLSFLRFGKKLAYVDRDLDTTAFRGWLEVEEKLSTLTFGDEDTASLRTIIARILGPLSVDFLAPKFGTGKVSEAHIDGAYDKLEFLSTNRRLEYAFLRHRPFRGSDEGFDAGNGVVRHRGSSGDVARLKFVPKDITKSRSICMEPNSFMYFQQGVLRWVKRSFDRGEIRRFVTLRDQTANQKAALHGSLYLSSDTIDLSSASDSVHAELVRRVFPPDWNFYMFATRTSSVKLPDGKVVKVNKFAPMGSALCFPVQCVIFTAVCLYAYSAYIQGKTTGTWSCGPDDIELTLKSIARSRTDSTPFGKRLEPPVVYGDDIIVDSRLTDIVISTLSRLGFLVNRNKSFTGSMSFRESCGVYAFEGQDVTPVLFRIPFIRRGKKFDAKVYASFIENINSMRSNGYQSVATFWLSVLKDQRFSAPLPFVTDSDAFGLLTANKHAVDPKFLRVNHVLPDGQCWQITEELVQGIGPRNTKQTRPENLDEYSYDQWWATRVEEDSTPRIKGSSPIRPKETRLRATWARCE